MKDHLSKEYLLMFNGVTEAIGRLEDAVLHLKRLQQAAENVYLDAVGSVEEGKEIVRGDKLIDIRQDLLREG